MKVKDILVSEKANPKKHKPVSDPITLACIVIIGVLSIAMIGIAYLQKEIKLSTPNKAGQIEIIK